MIRTLTNKVAASLAAVALALSVGLVSPAEATSRHQVKQSTSASISAPVMVTQIGGAGSHFGLLEWTPITGATEYRIHKTGSIRPTWRLFFVAPASMTRLEVSDKPGAIAVYRVTAIVSSREVLVGRFNYKPKR